MQFLREMVLSMEVALPFLLFSHTPHSFRWHFVLRLLVIPLDIVKGVYLGYLRIRESHFFIILLGPYRRFPVPPEEVQAGLLLDTLSLSP